MSRRTAPIVAVMALVVSACAAPPAVRGVLGGLGGGPDPVARSRTDPPRCDLPAAGRDFTYVHPGDVGVDLGAVRAAIDGAGPRLASSLRIYRHHCLIGRTVFDEATRSVTAPLFSMTKSVVSLLVGLAVTRGDLGLDDPISAHLPAAGGPQGAITVRQLLSQSSGLRFAWANDLAASADDSVAGALSMPPVHPPGTHFEYAQTVVTLLLAVVEAAVGEDVQAFAARELLGPIGISRRDWSWARDGAGHTHGYSWLDMTPIAVARVASLVADRGSWAGRRIIDAAYLEAMVAPSPTNPGYGFLVGVNAGEWHLQSFGRARVDHRRNLAAPPDTVIFSGFLDQYTFVVPSLDLVIVRTGLPGGAGWAHEMFRALLAGVDGFDYRDPGPAPVEDEFTWDWSTVIAFPELLDAVSR